MLESLRQPARVRRQRACHRLLPRRPLPIVEVPLAGRRLEVRWEWDRRPPAIGEVVEIAALPDILRFFDPPPSPDLLTPQ